MAAPPEAPWRADFLAHVRQLEPPTFVLGTVRARRALGPPSSPAAAPSARTVVFRGMWACLPVNPKNPAPLNPDTYRSHLPTITTDARMDKVAELMDGATTDAQSGGGAPVEAVFWVPAVQTQWRLRGLAYVVGPDIESEAAAPVRDALAPYMRSTGASPEAPWSWSRELTAHFGNLSPLMRGSFRNPPPGTPLSRDPGPHGALGLGQKVEDVEDSVARSNFRVVVIVPDEVDRVDLSDPSTGRRWNYKACPDEAGGGGGDSWKVTELWP